MNPAATLTAEMEALTTDQPTAYQGEGKPRVPTQPLKYHQMEAYTEELRRLERIRTGKPTDLDGQTWQEPMGGDPTAANARIRHIRKILQDQAPKRITGDRANQVHALATRMRDELFKPVLGSLTEAAARRSPAGAPGHLLRTEMHPTFKRAVVAYRRGVRALDPENPDPDIGNIERFRPSGEGPNGTATFMSDAVIPGNFAFGPQAKANWPFGEPTADTALKQAARVEQAQGETNGHTKPVRAKTPREPKPASPAQLAARAAMVQRNRERAAARREATSAGGSDTP